MQVSFGTSIIIFIAWRHSFTGLHFHIPYTVYYIHTNTLTAVNTHANTLMEVNWWFNRPIYNRSLFANLNICTPAEKLGCNASIFYPKKPYKQVHLQDIFNINSIIYHRQRRFRTSCVDPSHYSLNIFTIHCHADTVCLATTHMLVYILGADVSSLLYRQVYSWNLCKPHDITLRFLSSCF